MPRLDVELKNGGAELIYTDSLCFNSKKGLELTFPVVTDKAKYKATLKFVFEYTPDGVLAFSSEDLPPTTILLKFFNLSGPGGLLSPFVMTIGDQQVSLLLAGYALDPGMNGERIVHLTITLFRGVVT